MEFIRTPFLLQSLAMVCKLERGRCPAAQPPSMITQSKLLAFIPSGIVTKGCTDVIFITSLFLSKIQHLLAVVQSYYVFESKLYKFNPNKPSTRSNIQNLYRGNVETSTFTQLLQ